MKVWTRPHLFRVQDLVKVCSQAEAEEYIYSSETSLRWFEEDNHYIGIDPRFFCLSLFMIFREKSVDTGAGKLIFVLYIIAIVLP